MIHVRPRKAGAATSPLHRAGARRSLPAQAGILTRHRQTPAHAAATQLLPGLTPHPEAAAAAAAAADPGPAAAVVAAAAAAGHAEAVAEAGDNRGPSLRSLFININKACYLPNPGGLTGLHFSEYQVK